MEKLLLIFNLHSGKGETKNYAADIIDLYNSKGFEVTVYTTQYAGHIKKIISHVGEKYPLIVCSGGDGTLNETAAAVQGLKNKPVLGYIPSGSTNDFAASAGISKNPLEAAETAVNGMPFAIDLGSIQGKSFVYVAAFGAFTSVSYETPQNLKNILGYQAYVLEGIKQLANLKTYHMRVEWDDDNYLEDDFILGLVSNTHRVAGLKYITSGDTKLDDGLFEVLLIPHMPSAGAVKGLIKDLAEKDYNNTQTIYSFKAKKIRFICTEPVNWTADGEQGGVYTDTEINVIEKAITINFPPEYEK